MKILFIRHSESVDDLTDQFGGWTGTWADFPLTPNGRAKLEARLTLITELGVDFNLILSSPLLRAFESAHIIANYLKLPNKTFHYLKEHNKYGILSGLNKLEAQGTYPELISKLNNNEYIPGAEPFNNFQERVKSATELILTSHFDNNIIAVTHGGFLKVLFEDILKKEFTKAQDCGFILLEGSSLSDIQSIKIDGIS